MRTRMLASVALAALLTTGVAACGGDDDGGGGEALELDDVEAGSGVNNGGGDDAPDDEGDDEAPPDDEGDEGDDSGDDGPLFGDNLAEGCQTLVEASTAFSEVFSGSGEFDLGQIAEGMQQLADAAPAEIAADIQLLADAYADLAVALDGVDLNDPSSFQDPEIQQRLIEAGEVFSTPEFQEAITSMTTFLTTECSGVTPPG